MNKNLIKLSSTVLTALMLAGCSGGEKPSGLPTDKPTELPVTAEATQVPVTPTVASVDASLVFQHENGIDFKSLLPKLATHAVELGEEHGNWKAFFLTSPFAFDYDSTAEALSSTEFGRNLIYKKSLYENGEGTLAMKLPGAWYEDTTGVIRLNGFKSDALGDYDYEIEIRATYSPQQVTGPDSITVEIYATDIAADTEAMQKRAEEVLRCVFGDELAHALVYAKSAPDEIYEGVNAKYNKWYILSTDIEFEDENGNDNKYHIGRSLHKDSSDNTILNFSVSVRTTHVNSGGALGVVENYDTFAVDMPSEIIELFDGRLGDKFSIVESRDAFDKILRTGDRYPYKASFLLEYTYIKKELFTGGISYDIEVDYRKAAEDLHPWVATGFIGKFDLLYDEAGTMTEFQYSVTGITDSVGVSRLDDATQLETFEKCLPQLKEQLMLAFGDEIKVDELELSECEVERNSDDKIEALTYSMPAALNVFGTCHDGTVKVKFTRGGISDMAYGSWRFAYKWTKSE